MEISMQMIADRLISYSPEVYVSKDIQSSVMNVKLIYQEKSALAREFVYVAKAGDFQAYDLPGGYLNIICIGPDPLLRELCDNSTCNIIFLKHDYDVFAVFDEIQGFLFSKPLEPEEFYDYLKENSKT